MHWINYSAALMYGEEIFPGIHDVLDDNTFGIGFNIECSCSIIFG